MPIGLVLPVDVVTKFPQRQIFLVHLLLSISENFKDKDKLIISWKDYFDKQVPQLSQSNWSNKFSVTNGTYLASQLMG